MKNIKRWYYGLNKEKFEEFEVLYEDNNYILVKNIETKTFSFGLSRDFGDLYGFPVNQSCLSINECINRLQRFIEIANEYHDVNKTKNIYMSMLKILKEVKI